jgi:molybdenum cofactor cytidylyltransferase
VSIAAIVLAAGESARMGKPKALLRWGDRTFVEHAIALGRGCAPLVVVAGATPLPGLDVAVVHNAMWQCGPLSSLQVGLHAIAEEAWSGVLVLTVDRPHVDASTIAALLRAHASHPDAVLQPSHAGQRGHPILHPRDVAEQLLALPPTASARDVVHRPDVATRRTAVPVNDPAVLDNIDAPEDLERLLSTTR